MNKSDFHESILSVAGGRVLSLDQVSVAIITALTKEHAAVCRVLECHQRVVAERDGGDKTYHLGVIRDKSGDRGMVVAVALLPEMGNVAAATRATNIIRDCRNLKEMIVCGVAGAVPNPKKPEEHVRLGDIVVSGEGVLQYDLGKRVPGGFQIKEGIRPPSPNLLEMARLLQSDESHGLRTWEKYIDFGLHRLGTEFARPNQDTDLLREAEWTKWSRFHDNVIGFGVEKFNRKFKYEPIPHPDEPTRPRPRIFHGLIASASQVLKDRYRRDHLRNKYAARAVEMETAGAAHAAYIAGVGYFVVRGTCDYCNPDKNKLWHHYAALVAAAYTRALLESTEIRIFAGVQKVLVVIELVNGAVEEDGAPEPIPQDYLDRVIKDAKLGSPAGGESAVEGDSSRARTSDRVLNFPSGAITSHSTVEPSAPFTVSTVPPEEFLNSTIDVQSQNISAEQITDEGSALNGEYLAVSPTESESGLFALEAERQIKEIKDALEELEFDKAFSSAATTAEWLQMHEMRLDKEIKSRMYVILSRTETVRANTSKPEGKKPDLTLARNYLAKAKYAIE